jgi:glycosyltransferase involved in cell wall biosynthesis
MKILVVCQYYYPENFQITPICEQLVADGYDVTVLTGLPNYPTGIVPEEYKKGHRKEVINGVKVMRCYEKGRKKGALGLALNYVSFAFSATNRIKKIKPDFDLVFCYQLSPITMAIPAMNYSRKYGIPFFLYCCDLWPESMKMYIASEKNMLFSAIGRLSRKVYDSADMIACQSTSFIPYLKSVHHISDRKLIYIPTFADESYLSQDFTPEGTIVDFVFLGNLGIAQNLISVLKAVEKIKDVKGFMVHFVGDGTVLSEMKEYVSKHGLGEVVTFYGRRPVEEMPKFYKLADACLVSLKSDNQIGLTLPGKVQGYMAAGKPIIGMIDGSARDAIEESGCGLCVAADDVDALAMGMLDFIENRDKYKECSQKARAYFIENFKKDIFMRKIENEFERVGNK